MNAIAAIVMLLAGFALAGQSPDSRQRPRPAPEERDPNAYSDGYGPGTMPGMEQADRVVFGKLLADQLELVSGPEGRGGAWDLYASYGRDERKLWVRSEGAVVNGSADYTTSVEGLWWRPFRPFWATLVGIRQDFGSGAQTHVAFGVEGLAPYWFDVQATGYLATDGTLSARFKAGYDLLFTNRLILSPEFESNFYSKANPARLLGSGLGNVELQMRLRYEISRKFAPYVGVDWDRALGDTADRMRAGGRHASDARLVAGLRAWR